MVRGKLNIEYAIEWQPEPKMYRASVIVTGDTGKDGNNGSIQSWYNAKTEGEALSWAVGWAMDRVKVKDQAPK